MLFRVGMKVTMVEGKDFKPTVYKEIVPVFGVVYTIRDICYFHSGPNPDIPGLRFYEIRNNINYYVGGLNECCFDAAKFRRVTDISDLQKLAAEITDKLSKQKVLELTDQ